MIGMDQKITECTSRKLNAGSPKVAMMGFTTSSESLALDVDVVVVGLKASAAQELTESLK
jgi:hypothetical protein